MADRNRLGPLLAAITFNRVGTMAGCVDADIRADKTVIANCNTGFVEDSEIEVSKEPLSNAYLLAVVAAERLVDDEFIICHMTKQVLPDGCRELYS